MPLQLQNVLPDLVGKRGSVTLWNPDVNENQQVNITFNIHLTGNETLSQATQMVKDQAKQILQEALRLL